MAAAEAAARTSGPAPPPPTPRCLPQTPPHSSAAQQSSSSVTGSSSYTPRMSASGSSGAGAGAPISSSTPVRKMSKEMVRPEQVAKVHSAPKPVARLSLRAKVWTLCLRYCTGDVAYFVLNKILPMLANSLNSALSSKL